ncbi:MAG: carboxypeptidase-like regulatory domain-containing protein, partial [Terriglobia bacterium]
MGARQARWLVLLGCFLLLSPLCALGQSGTLAGRVTRAGAAVVGAQVRLESEAGRVYRALSDRSGRYAVVGLRPGSYRVEVDFGQWTAAVEGVQVEATGRAELDFDLGPPWVLQPARVQFDLSSPDYGTRYGDFQRHELPLPRNLWRVLENLDPSVVADRFDVGGIWTGRPALIATHGSSWQETSYFFEGVDLTDPLEPGKPMLYPDYDALNELQVSTAAHDLPARAPGAAVYLSSHEGSDTWRGRLFFSFQGQGLQADNRDADLEALGFGRPWEFQNFSEFNLRGGGPLTRDWKLYFSLGTQQLSFRVPAFDATPSARVFSGLLRLDYDPDPRTHLVLLWSGQNLRSRHLDGFPFSTELVTLRERHRHQAALARWEFRPSARTAAEAHFLYAHTNLSSLNPKETTGPHRRTLFQAPQARNLPADNVPPLEACPGVFCGSNSAALVGNSPRTRVRLGGGLTHELPGYAGITQQLLLQGYWSGGWTSSGLMTNQDTHLLFFPGETPFGVVQWNTPVRSEQRLHEVVVGGEHRLNLRGWLFVRLGLLLDHSRASLPAQGSPAGRF